MAISVVTSGTWLNGNEELAQSLQLYFLTPKGSIPLHPELGFGIFNYVDRNPLAVLHLIREVRKGIQLWDSRINIIKAQPTFTMGKLKMTITWSPADNTSVVLTSNVFI